MSLLTYQVQILPSDLYNALASLSVVPVFLLVGLAVADKICSPICTMEYNPLCAGDGVSKPRVFGNRCGFEYYNCANPDKRKLHNNCDFVFKP
jgi:hypothetical protein